MLRIVQSAPLFSDLNEDMDFVELVHTPINVDDVVNKVKAPGCGAVSVFIGTTRDNFNGRKVKSLFYESYKEMTVKAMESICQNIRTRWKDVMHIAVFHRMGEVPVTENCVVIAVSSPHRADSLAAVNYAIDEIKATAPIWKKENYEDEPGKWKENMECHWKS